MRKAIAILSANANVGLVFFKGGIIVGHPRSLKVRHQSIGDYPARHIPAVLASNNLLTCVNGVEEKLKLLIGNCSLMVLTGSMMQLLYLLLGSLSYLMPKCGVVSTVAPHI